MGMSGREDRATFKQAMAQTERRWRVILRAGAAVAAIASVLMFVEVASVSLSALRQSHLAPGHWVDLNETGQVASPSSGAPGDPVRLPIRIAVAPMLSPSRALPLYQDLADYLGDALDRPATVLFRANYAEFDDLVQLGHCDLAFVSVSSAARRGAGGYLRVIAAPMIDGTTEYHSYTIVPRGAYANSPIDLRGRRFASADRLSMTGWLYPACWLMRAGEDPTTFFSEHVITGSHDSAVTAVITGHADAASVAGPVYEHMGAEDPRVLESTRIILKSPSVGSPPVVAPAKADPKIVAQLRDALLAMHSDPAGKSALDGLNVDRFVAVDPQAYASAREVLAEVEGVDP